MRPINLALSNNGGKALGLRTLIKLGVPVPVGVALNRNEVRKILKKDALLSDELCRWLASRQSLLSVRSSATNEDGVKMSFAGMYETRLSVKPVLKDVISAIREVSTSGRSARLEAYSGGHIDTIPIVIQEQIEAKTSGVLFTRACEVSGRECVFVEWTTGLGDKLVSGRLTPSSVRIPWANALTNLDLNSITTTGSIPDRAEVEALVGMIQTIGIGHPLGWDVEWAIDQSGKIWALQLRPQTVEIMVPERDRDTRLLPVSPGIGVGPAKLVDDATHNRVLDGDVLVSQITEVDYIPAMKRAAAIVTEEGGLLSHAAIVARELGKPCVVGFKEALSLLHDGVSTEVNGSRGTVRQEERTFGTNTSGEIDWKSVYLYDRGILFDEPGVYIEPNLEGLIAFVDEELPSSQTASISGFVRRTFHQSADVLVGDRGVWFREWHRYNRLFCISLVSSLFNSPLHSWDGAGIRLATDSLKKCAEVAVSTPAGSLLEELFQKEVGAALHAMVSEVVEGRALWYSFRDSMQWRQFHGVSFPDLLAGSTPSETATPQFIFDIVNCMNSLGLLRNESYKFFESIGAFSGQYFGNREELVRRVCEQLHIKFVDDTDSLSEIYGHPGFQEMDRSFHRRFMRVIESIYATP